MDTITITKLFSTRLNDSSLMWTYQIIESGERFDSFSNDAFAAFTDHAIHKELEKQLSNMPDAANVSSNPLGLHLNTDGPYVPEEPMPKTLREEELEKCLIRAYGEVLPNLIHERVTNNCEACEIFDPSQDHHDCLMMENDIRVYRYLSETLAAIDQDEIMEVFMKNVETLNPELNALERLKYQYPDSKSDIVERRREELEDILIQKMNQN